MGQSRKAPSRGVSATPVVTKKRSSTPANGEPKPASNGVVVSDVNVSASSSKSHKIKKPNKRKVTARQTTVLDHVFRVALLSFVFYVLLVCPGDSRLESPTCRAIESWRLTLSPHLSKPINAILSHPSISPVVANVKPHYDQVIKVTTPYAQAIQAKAAPHIKAAQVKTHALTRPYVRRFQLEYGARIQPYVSKAQPHIYEFQRQINTRVIPLIQPHALRAQAQSKQIYSYSQRQWENHVHPKIIIPAWEQVKNIPVWLEDKFGDWVRDLKATYVDEQFKKMSAKIEELGGSSSSTITEPPMTKVINEATPSKLVEIVSSAAESSLSRATASSSSTADEVIETVAAEPVPTPSSSILSVASSIKASVETTPSTSSSAPIADETPSPAEEAEPEPEEDPLDFLAQFTAEPTKTEVEIPEPSTTDSYAEPRWTQPTLEETAAKRKDLEARLDQWAGKIEELGKANKARLIEDIKLIRSEAVASLDESSTDPDSIGFKVAAFKKSGSKALKGTLAYADKLMAGKYHGAEKIGLYDSVIKKVDTRYGEGAKEISETIATWWAGVREEVDRKMEAYAEDVKTLGETAQLNLGMDLSYLDDVTVRDWEKYHDLLNRAEAYRTRYVAIVDRTAHRAPIDPLPPALAALQADLEDHMATFATELINTRDAGFRLIKGKPMDDTKVVQGSSPAKPSGGFNILPVAEARDEFIGRGREEIIDAMNRAGEKVGAKKPTPSPALNKVNDVVDSIFADAQEVYEDVKQKFHDATEDVKQKVHDATRKASKAVGATPTPETFNEHVESVVDAASSALPTVNVESVSSYVDDTASSASSIVVEVYEEVTSTVIDAASTVSSVASSVVEDASSVIHHATRSVQSAAGVTPSPEVFSETTESLKAKAHSLTREAAKAAGLSVSPEGVVEHVSSATSEVKASASNVYANVESVVESVTSKVNDGASTASASVSSAYSEASAAMHEAVRKAAKAGGIHLDPEMPQEQTNDIVDELLSRVSATIVKPVHTATRSIAKAVGATPSPEIVAGHVESLTKKVASSVSSAYEDVSSSVHSGARKASKAAGIKPEPTGVKEKMEDLVDEGYEAVDDVKKSVESVAEGATSVVKEAYKSAESVVAGRHEEL